MNEPRHKSPAPARSLTSRTAGGVAWSIGQGLLVKVLDAVAFFVLAKLLLEEGFGLVGIAAAVRVTVDILSQMGISNVLVRRHLKFDRWATPALWMSIAVGVVGALMLVAVAPFIGAWFGGDAEQQRTLTTLVWILAAVSPLTALAVVPRAKLRSELRFRTFAIVGALHRVSEIVLRVVLVSVGLGPMGYVAAQPIAIAGVTVALWWLAKPRIRPRLQWRRWRFLFTDSAWTFMGSFFIKLVDQIDYMIIGAFHSTAMVGAYFFAFNLSIQPLRLFAASLEGVLMASLSHLQLDPERQVRAFLRAASLMAVLIVPICFVQALLFDPVFRLVFPDGTMHDAIRPGQIISVGMAIWAVYGPTASLLKAQGRFRTFAIMATIYATGFIVAVTLAARFGTVAHVAAAVGLCMIIDVPIKMYVAVRPGGAGWSDVLGVLGLPFAIGILAAGAAGGLAMLVPDVFGQNIARIVIVLLVTGAIYLPLIRATSPASWNEALEQLQRVLPQRLIRRLEVPLAPP